MSIVERRPITDWMKALLIAGTGKNGDIGRAPTANVVPYFIVYVIDGGEEWGAFSQPQSEAVLVYQVTSVGVRHDQAEWMADRVRRTMLQRDAAGAFLVQLAPPVGVVVQDRRPNDSRGVVEQVNDIFQVAERYEVCVGPA